MTKLSISPLLPTTLYFIHFQLYHYSKRISLACTAKELKFLCDRVTEIETRLITLYN